MSDVHHAAARGFDLQADAYDRGDVVSTLKAGSAVQVFDLASGRSVMNEKTSITLAHGVTVSSDSRYAFVSVEGRTRSRARWRCST